MKDPKAQQWLTRADGLATRLRQLRGSRSGLSLANALEWKSSAKVTRIEQGEQIPTEDDIAKWGLECGADQATVDQLQALLIEFRNVRGALRQRAKTAPAVGAVTVFALVRSATLIRTYSTASIPDIVRNDSYAEAVGDEPADPAWQNLLYEPTRRFELLLDEAVLHRRHGSAEVMADQIDRLVTLTTGKKGSRIRFGIVPSAAPGAVLPVQGFGVYDDAAFVETFAGLESGAPEVDYSALLAELWAAAVEGDEARKLIHRAVDAMRSA